MVHFYSHRKWPTVSGLFFCLLQKQCISQEMHSKSSAFPRNCTVFIEHFPHEMNTSFPTVSWDISSKSVFLEEISLLFLLKYGHSFSPSVWNLAKTNVNIRYCNYLSSSILEKFSSRALNSLYAINLYMIHKFDNICISLDDSFIF